MPPPVPEESETTRFFWSEEVTDDESPAAPKTRFFPFASKDVFCKRATEPALTVASASRTIDFSVSISISPDFIVPWMFRLSVFTMIFFVAVKSPGITIFPLSSRMLYVIPSFFTVPEGVPPE